MDVLRALSSPNMDIRKKTLDIALDLITARNIDEVRRRFRPLVLFRCILTYACHVWNPLELTDGRWLLMMRGCSITQISPTKVRLYSQAWRQ